MIKTGPNPGVTSWNQRNKDVEFICGENDSGEQSKVIMALLSFYSYDAPGVKIGPTLGVTSWNNRNKEGRIIFVGKMTEQSRAIMALLFVCLFVFFVLKTYTMYKLDQ